MHVVYNANDSKAVKRIKYLLAEYKMSKTLKEELQKLIQELK